MALIIGKVELSLRWDLNCALCTLTGDSTFMITDAILYVQLLIYQQKTMQNYENY